VAGQDDSVFLCESDDLGVNWKIHCGNSVKNKIINKTALKIIFLHLHDVT
jgi:hypothetical protein